MMRAMGALAAIIVSLTAGCTETGFGHGPSVSPPSPAPSRSASVSPTPTGSPGSEALLANGVATLSLTGDLLVNVLLPTLGDGAQWSPPPAAMALTWTGPRGQQLGLTGTSFLSRQGTSPDRSLSFTVAGTDGPVEFSSTAGECTITITPALPDNMGGIFTCTTLTDVEGATTVDARGAFSATA
jgi:hypothetical protein